MHRDQAITLLKEHSGFSCKNERSFLYLLKERNEVNRNLFLEIMDCIVVISNTINIAEVSSIYGIAFWCRSWIDAGYFQDRISSDAISELKVYVGIIEETLYYLLQGEKEEAFWAYNEYLNGRL